MRRLCFLLLLGWVVPAGAAEKAPPIPPRPVVRIDSLIATETGNYVTIEAKGAVSSGGWRGAVLKAVKSTDPHMIVLDFVATPPAPTQAVIMALLPVAASTTLRLRRGVVSVKAVSGSNEITTQILK